MQRATRYPNTRGYPPDFWLPATRLFIPGQYPAIPDTRLFIPGYPRVPADYEFWLFFRWNDKFLAVFRQCFKIFGYFPPNFQNVQLFSAKFSNFWPFSAKISKFLTIFCQNPETSVKIHATYYPTGTRVPDRKYPGTKMQYPSPPGTRLLIPEPTRDPTFWYPLHP